MSTRCTIWTISLVERDELRKDIEQLCMQQAGTSYLAVATRMHFQRYNIFLTFQQVYLLLTLFPLHFHLFLGWWEWKRREEVPVASLLVLLRTQLKYYNKLIPY